MTRIDITPKAPIDAKYIVQQANGVLTAEQDLSALATGLVQNTTSTGVLSIPTASAARDLLELNAGQTGDIWVEKAGDTMTGALTLQNSVTVETTNGIDINPGSDTDFDIITLGVTNSPTIEWLETEDAVGIRDAQYDRDWETIL